MNKKKIIIVDDDIKNRELIEQRLTTNGYDVVTASDGETGLELIKVKNPDLIILDLLLPGIDGSQLCKIIKNDEAFKNIPVIILTDIYVDKLDIERILQFGADEYIFKPNIYLNKPFSIDEFIKSVKILLGEEKKEGKNYKGKILVIDDDVENLEILKIRLESRDYKISTAVDGEIGLKELEKELPDLVLLDIRLPGIDGIEVLKTIRKKYSNIAVVMMTAYGSEDVAVSAMKEGANDYLKKPINHTELILKVEENIEKARLKFLRDNIVEMLKESNTNLITRYEALAKLNKQFKETQDKIIEIRRKANLGGLYADLAYELNKPLQTILMNIQILKADISNKKMDIPWQWKNIIEKIEESSLKTIKIVEDILTFSIESIQFEFKLLDINSIIDETLNLLKSQIPLENINIIKNYGQNLPKIYGDLAKLTQVFINIILNAKSSMHEGGDLKISTRLTENFIDIEFTDTGEGIPPEYIDKIFDPYFTTRKKSIGVGLFISLDIVKQYKGTISAKSEVGKGTTFNIYLPVISTNAIKNH